MTLSTAETVLITGAAGLVGQNLIPRIKSPGRRLIAVDKHGANAAILRRLHPDVEVLEADLSRDGPWCEAARRADSLIIAHAQIGGLDRSAFVANNQEATARLLKAATSGGRAPYALHISSSVVNSVVQDWYVESKRAQEAMVKASGLPHVVLRPTLMFGWFDRKHLGWLKRFMERTPVFPVPGDGRFRRQPLYAGDFCAVVAACLEERRSGTHDVSGLETVDYIELIRAVREAAGLRTPIVKIPYHLFWLMLWSHGLVSRNPPFTTKQLEALVTPELFPITNWPNEFRVRATPLRTALHETFAHPEYSKIVLEF
ncbi:NAD-dependent epimerase/dehydratase family protein [Muricoccus radiodurans]|uniref:NAD-dependent epimerase/dehydratase family protein n=1 Tax=Muricoccus radiodurans TaxID=2231721 RepID=UPI003CEE7976